MKENHPVEFRVALDYARRMGLPAPQGRPLGSGCSGVVYATADPAVVVKLASTAADWELMEHQKWPAVIRILHIVDVEYDGDYDFLTLAWKERLADTDVQRGLGLSRRDDDSTMQMLDGLPGTPLRGVREIAEALRRIHPGFAQLADALPHLPREDLTYNNVGVGIDGFVKVFDL